MSSQPGTYRTVQWVTVEPEYEGQRVDNFLFNRLKGVPKSRVYRILRKGEVRINKARVKPEYKLKSGDSLRIPPIRMDDQASKPKAVPSQSLWQHLNQSILFEDDTLMVINKPSGMAVHGGDGIELGLIEAMRQIRDDCRYLELVHRLDKETSGCVMIAKKRSMLKHLQNQLRNPGGIDKRYLALVYGAWPRRVSHIEQPLKRLELPDGNRIVKVHPEGKPSATNFTIVEQFTLRGVGPLTLVEAKPLTGRTHQIRVHAQFAGHSLIGDKKYGNDDINKAVAQVAPTRLCLHAKSLVIPPPETEPFTVEAPLLPDLTLLLDRLRTEE